MGFDNRLVQPFIQPVRTQASLITGVLHAET